MKTVLIALIVTLSGCAGMAVESYPVHQQIPGKSFKTVEIYKHNAFGPSFAYTMLYACDDEGNGCVEQFRTPTTTPGFISSLIAPVIQAGAILGGAALIGEAIGSSGDSISLNNASTSMSRSSANAAAISRSSATAKGGLVVH